MEYMEAIKLYIDTFNEGPPIYGVEEEEAIASINEAIETGIKIEHGAEDDVPPEVVI